MPSEILWKLTVGQIQRVAFDRFGRKLTPDELTAAESYICDCLDYELAGDNAYPAIQMGINTAVDNCNGKGTADALHEATVYRDVADKESGDAS